MEIEQATAAPGELRQPPAAPKERWFWRRCRVLRGGTVITVCVAREGHDGPHNFEPYL